MNTLLYSHSTGHVLLQIGLFADDNSFHKSNFEVKFLLHNIKGRVKYHKIKSEEDEDPWLWSWIVNWKMFSKVGSLTFAAAKSGLLRSGNQEV
jgi:hypothetical protein